MTTEPLVSLENVSVTFRRWGNLQEALRSVTMYVNQRELILLRGHNGSGKSTLLEVIAGNVECTGGRVLLRGMEHASMTRAQRAQSVFLVRQNPMEGTAPLVAVFENLLAADPTVRGVSRKSLLARYQEMLLPLGLGDRLLQPIRTLSGGERQLIAILIGQLRPAPLLLVDEPFAALDDDKVRLCVDQLRQSFENGKTVIVVSHTATELDLIATRILTVRQGALVGDARGTRSPDSGDLVSLPTDLVTAR